MQHSLRPTAKHAEILLSEVDASFLTCDDEGAAEREQQMLAPIADNDGDAHAHADAAGGNKSTLVKRVSKRVQRLAVDLVTDNEKAIETGDTKLLRCRA